MNDTRVTWIDTLRHADVRLVDAGAALLLTAVVQVAIVAAEPEAGARAWDVPGVALAVASTVAIALLHVAPLPAFATTIACTTTLAMLGYQLSTWLLVAGVLSLFVISASASYRRSLSAAALAGAALLTLFLTSDAVPGIITKLGVWGWYSATFVLGIIIKTYRESVTEARRRASLFAADREARAREAVADERVRLARELHDVVGHALNVVVIQAAGAQRVLDTKPQLAREALANIEVAGRQALQDVERMLGILRSEHREEADLQAPPGLGRLPDLVDQVTQAGLPTSLAVHGVPVDIPASLDLSAYRIVQEALTNSLKHAGRARASVAVSYGARALEVEVTDNGRGSDDLLATSGGRGIHGMRERALVFGGQLEAGPLPGGGFRVWAWLPLSEEAQ